MTLEEIKRGKTGRIEFKREVPQKDKRYLKTVVAFANRLGGSVVFGIDDKTLDVVGVPDDNLRKIEDGLASAISSACAPAIVPSFSRETVDGKTLLIIDIYPGRNTPYHIRAEGLGGVYLRVGATTRKAELEQIEELILRGGNKTYEILGIDPKDGGDFIVESGNFVELSRLKGWPNTFPAKSLVTDGWRVCARDGEARVRCRMSGGGE